MHARGISVLRKLAWTVRTASAAPGQHRACQGRTRIKACKAIAIGRAVVSTLLVVRCPRALQPVGCIGPPNHALTHAAPFECVGALGIEGLDRTDRKTFLQAVDAPQFADAILASLDDASMRARLAEAVRRLMEEQFTRFETPLSWRARRCREQYLLPVGCTLLRDSTDSSFQDI